MGRNRDKPVDRFDGYGVELHVDDDGDWLARFEELPDISAFGPTPETALHELVSPGASQGIVCCGEQTDTGSALTASLQQSNQLPIDKRVHRKLAIEAERNGLRPNVLIAKKLAEPVD